MGGEDVSGVVMMMMKHEWEVERTEWREGRQAEEPEGPKVGQLSAWVSLSGHLQRCPQRGREAEGQSERMRWD